MGKRRRPSKQLLKEAEQHWEDEANLVSKDYYDEDGTIDDEYVEQEGMQNGVAPPPMYNDPYTENIQDYYPDGMGSLSAGQKYPDLLKELTNFTPYIRDTINDWLGLKWDEKEGKATPDPLVTPIMNIKCAIWCISQMKTYARSNNIITDINKEDYTYILLDIVNEVWLNLIARGDEFGIKHNGDIIKICNKLEHSARLVLMGAGDGRYNRLLAETYSHNTSESQQQGMMNPMMIPAEKRRGVWGKMKRVLFGTGG